MLHNPQLQNTSPAIAKEYWLTHLHLRTSFHFDWTGNCSQNSGIMFTVIFWWAYISAMEHCWFDLVMCDIHFLRIVATLEKFIV